MRCRQREPSYQAAKHVGRWPPTLRSAHEGVGMVNEGVGICGARPARVDPVVGVAMVSGSRPKYLNEEGETDHRVIAMMEVWCVAMFTLEFVGRVL
eukprot:gene13040-11569_t